MKIESLEVTVIGMNHTPRGKGMPPFHCGPQSPDSLEDIFDESDHYWVFRKRNGSTSKIPMMHRLLKN